MSVTIESNSISDNSESPSEVFCTPNTPISGRLVTICHVLAVPGETGRIKFTPKFSDILFDKFTLLCPGAGTTTRVGN